jgi:hypothetical protein
MRHHRRRGLGDAEINNPVDEEAPTHAERPNTRGEDLGGNYVARDAVPE